MHDNELKDAHASHIYGSNNTIVLEGASQAVI